MASPDPIRDEHVAPAPTPDHPNPLHAAPGEDRVLTVPNLLTLLRLLTLPVFVWLLFDQEDPLGAAVLLAVLSSTDFVDGWVARRFDQGSRLGKLFDPTADRIVFFVAITCIIIDDAAPRWFAIIVLVREVVVASITVTLLAMRCPPVDVTWFGKAGTFGLMFAFPLWLGGSDPSFEYADQLWALGWVAGVPGLALSLYAAISYVPLWREALREGRVIRAGRARAAERPG